MNLTVLLLFEYPTVNGGERSALSVLPHIRAAGFRIIAAGPRGGFAERLKATCELVEIDWQSTGGAQSGKREVIESVIHSVRPALVHANSLGHCKAAWTGRQVLENTLLGTLARHQSNCPMLLSAI